MNKRAVTKAQMRRTVEALEAMGKTIADVILLPDGSWQLRLTNGHTFAPSNDDNKASDDWDKALGL